MIPNPPGPAQGCTELIAARVTSVGVWEPWAVFASGHPGKHGCPRTPCSGTARRGPCADRHPGSCRKVAQGSRAPWAPSGLELGLELARQWGHCH